MSSILDHVDRELRQSPIISTFGPQQLVFING